MNSIPLGTMPLSTFLSEHWQKKPLLIRNAIPNIVSPLTADELAGLACEENIESRIVIQNESVEQWELKHGPFSEKTFSFLPATHWTLLVQAVDHWIPEAAKFLELFSFIPRWRIDDLMMSYASDGGGVGPHFDNYDVFLVQTNGKRRWQVGELYDENSSLIENLPVSILSNFKAVETWLLEPGDILYIPPGYGHNGIAVGDDCITCSVGFRAPSHAEILREYTDHISQDISDAIRYEDANLIEQSNTGEISHQTLGKIQQILRQYTEDTNSINDWFGRYMTTPKYSEASVTTSNTSNDVSNIVFSLEKVKHYLVTGGQLIRNEGSRFAYISEAGKNILYVDGTCISSSNNMNLLIETLCSEIELNNQMFPESNENMALLSELLQRGALYIPES